MCFFCETERRLDIPIFWLPTFYGGKPIDNKYYKQLLMDSVVPKKHGSTLQICAVKLQWKCIEKTVILKNYSSLLLTYVRCIFYKLKIVSLTLFSCSLFCIELNVHITSFHCF